MQGKSGSSKTALQFHAVGFMVRVAGAWTESTLDQFRQFVDERHVSASNDELVQSLELAKEHYLARGNELYLCGAQPCCSRSRFDVSDSALAATSKATGLQISQTGCQGICKHAPVMSLRIGSRSQAFAQVKTDSDWRAVLTFAEAAARGGSLLVANAEAERFFHDPVHDHARPATHLRSLAFLLGHFRGEGRQARNSYTFEKEVFGTYEAGGRFIALRMDASYPMANGHKDVHKALVIVGAEPSSGNITGRAYTDGGITHEYSVDRHDEMLEFADASPDHSLRWKRARKILKPTNDGYEERLEVDAGDGFETYYTIPMRKIS